MTTPPGGPPESLQFDAAEPAKAGATGVSCTVCKRTIGGAYHMVNNAIICGSCRGRLELELKQGSGGGRFSRAVLYGLGGAVAGALIYYAVAAITGYELSLISILVGFMVGKAVQKGSDARGGWAYQALAMGLTYLAIVSTYVPFIIRGFREQAAAQQAEAVSSDSAGVPITLDTAGAPLATVATASTASTSDSGVASVQAADSAGTTRAAPTLAAFAIALAALLLLAALAPILNFNVIGIFIIGVALYEAWKLNKRVPLAITGPYQVGTAPA